MPTSPSRPPQDPKLVPSGDPHREPDGLPEWDPEQSPPDADVEPADVAASPSDPVENIRVDPPAEPSNVQAGQIPESANPEVND